jgi:hypothetical protein
VCSRARSQLTGAFQDLGINSASASNRRPTDQFLRLAFPLHPLCMAAATKGPQVCCVDKFKKTIKIFRRCCSIQSERNATVSWNLDAAFVSTERTLEALEPDMSNLVRNKPRNSSCHIYTEIRQVPGDYQRKTKEIGQKLTPGPIRPRNSFEVTKG